MHHHVSVEQHAALTRERCRLSIYQSCDFLEGTTKGYQHEQYLPLPCLDVVLVESALLEVSEPQLSWSCLIRVGSAQHHLDAKVLNALPCLSRSMVRCSVQQHHDLLSPAHSVPLREGIRKFREEHLHDVLVSVALSLRKPDRTLRRHSADEIDLVSH